MTLRRGHLLTLVPREVARSPRRECSLAPEARTRSRTGGLPAARLLADSTRAATARGFAARAKGSPRAAPCIECDGPPFASAVPRVNRSRRQQRARATTLRSLVRAARVQRAPSTQRCRG